MTDQRGARLYVYIVRYDIGFAPNPFYGSCTLATCKSGIRKGAKVGDWIVGIGSKQEGQDGLLVYAMRVDEDLTFDGYWNDLRFQDKKTNRSGSIKQRYGDNIYHHNPDDGSWIQEDSRHSLDGGNSNIIHIKKDTKAPRVLISNHYVYYGNQAASIPNRFRNWDETDICECGRDYKYKYSDPLRKAFASWLDKQVRKHKGIVGEPLLWSKDANFYFGRRE